ncbi:MAG TPA: hypothetical protein PLC98_21205, partial [Anaerolineales bacterium]|nr:hypothetical protein [Anaerolineales bacterium]
RNPPGETGPLAPPALSDWLGWGLAWLGLLVVVWIPRERLRLAWLAVAFAVLELGWSSRALPLLATLTAPEAYSSLRPALTQLLIDPARANANGAPPGRVLSMSALQFDPGDLGELKALYGPQLSASGYETLIVATKHKEVLSPNLALTWHVPGVDGFDGGVLPTRAYAEFAALFTGEPSSDGRLREHVTVAPDPRWLALVDARWLITDKTGDDWIEGIAYDRLFTRTLAAGETATLTIDPAFPATELGVIAATPGRLVIVAGDRRAELSFDKGLDRIALPFAPDSIELQGPLTVEALTAIDSATGAFQMIPLRNVRLAHSGDVKVYEVLDRMSRAFVTETSEVVGAIPKVLDRLKTPGFDPADIALVSTDLSESYVGDGSQGAVRFVSYAPEEVILEATGPGTLVLTDAFAPGWRATLDGAETPIVPAYGLFRAIALPPGTHMVRFVYAPQSVTFGLALSGIGLALWLFAFAQYGRRGGDAGSVTRSV